MAGEIGTVEKAKITVKLVGTDGNAYALIGRVSRALKDAGQREEARAFMAKATDCKSYDELLRYIMGVVDVE